MDRIIERFLESCHSKRFEAKSRIIQQGDVADKLFYILKGSVRVLLQLQKGHELVLAYLNAGEFFGEMANFEDRPRSADAVGAEQGSLLVLSPERFRQIILQDPAISFEIFRVLSARLRRFDEEAMEASRSLEDH